MIFFLPQHNKTRQGPTKITFFYAIMWFSFSLTSFDVSNILNSPNLTQIPQITMSFAKVYSSVLSPFVDNFKNAKNEKARKVVLSDAAAAVEAHKNSQEDSGELPENLSKVCLIHSAFIFSGFNYFRLSLDI